MFFSLCLSPSSPQSYDGDKKISRLLLHGRKKSRIFIDARVPAVLT